MKLLYTIYCCILQKFIYIGFRATGNFWSLDTLFNFIQSAADQRLGVDNHILNILRKSMIKRVLKTNETRLRFAWIFDILKQKDEVFATKDERRRLLQNYFDSNGTVSTVDFSTVILANPFLAEMVAKWVDTEIRVRLSSDKVVILDNDILDALVEVSPLGGNNPILRAFALEWLARWGITDFNIQKVKERFPHLGYLEDYTVERRKMLTGSAET